MTETYHFTEYGEAVQQWVNGILTNRGSDAQTMLQNCDSLIEHGKRTQDDRLLGFAYYFRAENFYILNSTDDFLKNIMTALAYLDASGQWELMAHAYNLMAITSINRGNAPFAMDYYLTSLKYCQTYEIHEMGTIININIGMLYLDFEDYQQAGRYFEAGLSLLQRFDDLPGREDLLFSANIGLANTCLFRHDLMGGRSYLDRARTAGKIGENPINRLVYHCFEARIHHEEKKFALRDEAIKEASRLIEQDFPLMDIFEDIYHFCELLLAVEKYDELLQIMEKLESMTKQSSLHHLQKRILGLKIKYYKQIGENAGYLQAAGLYYEISEMMEKENSFMIGKMLNIRSFLEESTKRQREMREENEALHVRSETDALTGLANRFRLNMEVKKLFEKAASAHRKFAIEILDIDYFKQFNDNYGHQEGDRCIVGVAQQIRSMQEHRDIFVSRYGGDEFVMIYLDYNKDEVETLMGELRDKIVGMAMRHEFSKAASVVTISQGACWGIPNNMEKAADYLHLADDMLYQIKKVSRNSLRVCEFDAAAAQGLENKSGVELS